MANAKNEKQVAALREILAGKGKTFFVVDYQGLSAGELAKLRKKVRAAGGRLLVAKNTLVNVVLKEDEIHDFGDALKGPSALVLVDKDPSALAKAITDYIKAHPKNLPVSKGGLLEGKKLAATALQDVARMPSREQLMSEFLGVLQGPMQQLVGVLEAGPRDLVSVLQNYADKQKEAQ